MKTQSKIFIAFIATFAIAIAGLFIFRAITDKQNKELTNLLQTSEQQTIGAVLLSKTDFWQKLVKDYSCFDDMVTFVNKPDTTWAKETITLMQSFKMQALWIYNARRQIIYNKFDTSINQPFSLPDGILDTLFAKHSISFFMQTKFGLMEVTGSTIHPSNDINRKTTPAGFFIAGKLWNINYLNNLKLILNKTIELEKIPKDSTQLSSINFYYPLFDWQHKTITYIFIKNDDPYFAIIKHINNTSILFIIILTLIIIFISYITFQRLVISPLNFIANSLIDEDISHLDKMTSNPDEFGEIARLIIEFFEQNENLQNEITVRTSAESGLKELNAVLIQQKEEVRSQRDSLEVQATELSMQNEEISTQRDALEMINSELMQQKEETLTQNEELKIQRDLITEKNTKIIASIQYAQKIQAAVLPSQELFEDIFPDSFILYIPKDIISGDFYWIKQSGSYIYFAGADCTGHGVPGALMSMLGITLLNEIIINQETVASEVLNSLRTRIIKSLQQTGRASEAKDGIDIAIGIFNLETRVLQYAGANNSLYILRKKDNDETEFIELEADKMPVGLHPNKNVSFKNNEIQLLKNDCVYIFSDGIADQFSRATGRKFHQRRLKDFFISNFTKSMVEQKMLLEDSFLDWKGDSQQIDDVLAMGIRFARIGDIDLF